MKWFVESMEVTTIETQKKKVQILLSTYNGAAWLSQQIDSLINQTYSNYSILIRDDGSEDATKEVLRQYERRLSCLHWYDGENLGVWKSFFDLMEHADQRADYFAFCDQDDVWYSDKLEWGIQKLEQFSSELPLLYCGALQPVNNELCPIRITLSYKGFRPSFGNAVIQNIATGCTCIFNRALLQLVCVKKPDYMVMHDWWMYLTASCFGKVIYDEIPKIYYRQHKKNSIGARTSRKEQLCYRLKNFRKNRGNLYRQNEEFLRIFSLSEEKKRLIEDFLETKKDWKKRIAFFHNCQIYRQDRFDDFLYRIIVWMGMA